MLTGPRRRPTRRDERGLSLTLMALILVVLLSIAALVVDLGSWQAEASQVQQAADAAALAGVVRLPDGPSAATSRAREVAADNGYQHGTDGVTVVVNPLGNETLEVTITKPDVRQFFSQVVRDATSITRSSTSQYVQPVPLGSPRNFLGTNQLLAGQGPASAPNALVENYWLAVSNDCTRREYGDRVAARWNAWPVAQTCSVATLENEEFVEEGYLFGIEVPEALDGSSVAIQMYDAPTCPGSAAGDENNAPFPTEITVRDDDALDPFAGSELVNVTLEGGTIGNGNCVNGTTPECAAGLDDGAELRNCWATLHTVSSAGTYYVQVDPVAVNADTRHNNFALRAEVNGTFTPCTADSTDATPGLYSASCPNVFGIDHLPVLARVAGTASFFLADVGSQHNNKTMQITLYDAAEGAETIRIRDPNNNLQSFDWEVLCWDGSRNVGGTCPQGDQPPTGGWENAGAAVTTLNVAGTGTKTFPGNGQDGKYSDRLVRLSFQLPENIATAYGGRTWWRIEYGRPDTGTDRTTWSVQLLGNPVRLVPNATPTTTP